MEECSDTISVTVEIAQEFFVSIEKTFMKMTYRKLGLVDLSGPEIRISTTKKLKPFFGESEGFNPEYMRSYITPIPRLITFIARIMQSKRNLENYGQNDPAEKIKSISIDEPLEERHIEIIKKYLKSTDYRSKRSTGGRFFLSQNQAYYKDDSSNKKLVVYLNWPNDLDVLDRARQLKESIITKKLINYNMPLDLTIYALDPKFPQNLIGETFFYKNARCEYIKTVDEGRNLELRIPNSKIVKCSIYAIRNIAKSRSGS